MQSEGSGFIVRPDGYIFTNYHVVEGADRDRREAEGWPRISRRRSSGRDEKTDIAVIKIEAKNLPVVQFGDSDAVRVGQFAFAIGAPFKLDYTFTYGVISGKGRSKLIDNGGYNISDYLQTDASINPGNSGGPLCDIDGKVVGMNTLINGFNRGLGFAIPSNLVNEIGAAVDCRAQDRAALARHSDRNARRRPVDPRFIQRRRQRRGRAHDRSRRAGLQKRAASVRCDHAGRWRAGRHRHAASARDFEKESRTKRRTERLAQRPDDKNPGHDRRIA